MIIHEKCAVISCNREVYEMRNRVLRYCFVHAWLDSPAPCATDDDVSVGLYYGGSVS